MCGIIGLLAKNPSLRASLGELMVPMLTGMAERGPDSAGLAVFTEPVAESDRKYSLYSGNETIDWMKLSESLNAHLNGTVQIEPHNNHAVLISNLASNTVKQWLKEHYPTIHILSTGRTIDLYKDAGPPPEVADRYNFKSLKGTHVVAHTRMATESTVTPAHAYPFTAGEDFCLVHNGSLQSPLDSSQAGTTRHPL